MLLRVLAIATCLVASTLSIAAPDTEGELRLQSGRQATPLLELFTSEGCSSCPPAERWFNALEREPGLWRDFVPVVWHVDYWNYLGWEDRFAQSRFSQRQYDYHDQGNLSQVYTPGVLSAGREYRAWRSDDLPPRTSQSAGQLSLTARGEVLEVRFESDGERRASEANLVLLGMDLASEVTRGENRGRSLQHQFVVLDWQRQTLQAENETAIAQFAPFKLPDDESRLAVAAWVTGGSGETVIQAVGGWWR